MLLTSEFSAFPQAWAVGWDVPKDPETGEPMPGVALEFAQSRLLSFADPDVKLGQFQAANLANYVPAIDLLLQHLSAQTRTPPHYLLAELVNVSGDALTAAEAGLEFRCEKKILDFSDPWEETEALAFRAKDPSDPRADAKNIHTVWAPTAKQSIAQTTDAAVKMRQGLNVPAAQAQEVAGFTQADIARMAQANGGSE
jgi:hypothetical protein